MDEIETYLLSTGLFYALIGFTFLASYLTLKYLNGIRNN